MIRWKLLVLSLCCAAIAPASGVFLQDEVAEDPAAIFQGLPWKFMLSSSEQEHPGGTLSQRYRFVSVRPAGRGVAGDVHARVFLEVSFHGSPAAAGLALEHIRDGADPDWGLSYAWDYLLQHGGSLYRLHADCSLSREYFAVLVKNLDRLVTGDGGDPGGGRLFCTCGAGCRTPG